MPMPLPVPTHALLAATLLSACAAPRQSWRDVRPPEVLVEVLPSGAEVSVDGVPVGVGSREIAVPDPGRRYVFRAAAAGFEAAERADAGAQLAGARIGLVLRPEGFGTARRLQLDEGDGLASAAAFLSRAGRPGVALEYAQRAVDVSPGDARAQRVLGDVAVALGRYRDAIQAYSAYLRLAPDAPDRAAVEARVEGLRGDVTLPGPRR